MRTIIDIPDEQLKPLDAWCEEEGVSRAELVRRMIDDGLKKKKQRKKMTLEDIQELFKNNSPWGDGLEYQYKIRSEWDDRDHAIDEWRERQKSHPIDFPKLSKQFRKRTKSKK